MEQIIKQSTPEVQLERMRLECVTAMTDKLQRENYNTTATGIADYSTAIGYRALTTVDREWIANVCNREAKDARQ
jgi:hypothetical protein